MAKSAGNFLTLELLMDKGYDPLAYRYFCLNAHYRAQLTFTWEALDGAQTAIRRLRKQVAKLREAGLGEINERYIERFKAAVFDDLAMSRAVAAMWDAIKDDALCDADTYATLLQMDAVLGFGFDTLEPQEEGEAPEEIVEMAERRKAARAEKNFAEADRLRDAIAEKGYTIEDTPEGYKLHAN
jgi:cysteinyl-tRNA synthetase